jgi:hypothetical protein
VFSNRYVDECQILTVPSSEPDRMMGNDGWKMAKDTLAVWDSRVWIHDFEW